VRDDDHGKSGSPGSRIVLQRLREHEPVQRRLLHPEHVASRLELEPEPVRLVCSYDSDLGAVDRTSTVLTTTRTTDRDGHSFLTNRELRPELVFCRTDDYYNSGAATGSQAVGRIHRGFHGRRATFPIVLAEVHHNNPATDIGARSVTNTALGGQSNVIFRFRYESNDDWLWAFDNVRDRVLARLSTPRRASVS